MKFKTKTGYCHISDQELILTKDSELESGKNYNRKRSIIPILFVYGAFGAILIYTGVIRINKEEIFTGILSLLFGLLQIFVVVKSSTNSVASVIELSKIQKTEFKPAKKFMTRSYFIVHFQNDKGKLLKRLIMLPGSMSDAEKLNEEALTIMREKGLLNTT